MLDIQRLQTMHSTLTRSLLAVVALGGAALATSTHGAAHSAVQARDVVETAEAAGSFETLATALRAAGLVDALRGDGPFTVFAPTDEAFAALPEGALESLLRPENRDDLVTVLTYHVVPGRLDAADVARARGLDTLGGQRLGVATPGGRVVVGDANVVQANVECSNGIVHAIDRVLLPSTGNLVEVAAEAGSFGTLLQAATAAGLPGALAGDGPFTVLAPTDEAFAALPKGTLEALLADPHALGEILKYHVIPGRVFGAEALAAGSARTLQGDAVRFGLEDGMLRAGGARVLANDVQATNGVIHAIDAVLLPPGTGLPALGRKVIGVYTERPSSALAAQLGIDRHQSLLITKLTRGGPAASAGLAVHDVLTSIDGRPATTGNLNRAKEERGVGGSVHLRLVRAGRAVELDVPVGVERH